MTYIKTGRLRLDELSGNTNGGVVVVDVSGYTSVSLDYSGITGGAYYSASGGTIYGGIDATGYNVTASTFYGDLVGDVSANTLYYQGQEIDNRFVNVTGDTMTGKLIINIPGQEALDVIGNVNMTGNLYVSGTTTYVNTENMNVKDNMITINSGETGSGVTLWYSGIEVDRGELNNYIFVFDEVQDNFRIGESASPTGGTQAVATREDVPTASGLAYWNAELYRFDTDSNLIWDGSTLDVNGSVSANTYYGDGSNLTGLVMTPAGNHTEIQINSGGSFAATSLFKFDFDYSSVTFGTRTGSIGNGSTSWGGTVESSNVATFAIGVQTIARGLYSFAMGRYTMSSGQTTYAGGLGTSSYYNTASGIAAFNHSYRSSANGSGATGDYSAVLGGENNSATGYYSAVLGGRDNSATGNWAVVLGGYDNSATFTSSVVIGGIDNVASNDSCAIIGGDNCIASAKNSFAVGINTTSSGVASFAGGQGTEGGRVISNGAVSFNFQYVNSANASGATGAYSVILGGRNASVASLGGVSIGNNVSTIDSSSNYTAIIAGLSNSINTNSRYSGIFGGSGNTLSNAEYGAIIGGTNNDLGRVSSAIIGGTGNTISHDRSVILGGYDMTTTSANTVYMRNLSVVDNVDSDLVPKGDGVYSLGSTTYQWKDVWVSGGTIYLDRIPLSTDGTNLLWSGSSLSVDGSNFSKIIYVDSTNGSDTLGTGGAALPYQTLEKALEVSNPKVVSITGVTVSTTSTTILISDTSQIAVGDKVYCKNVLSDAIVNSISTNVSVTISSTPSANEAGLTITFYQPMLIYVQPGYYNVTTTATTGLHKDAVYWFFEDGAIVRKSSTNPLFSLTPKTDVSILGRGEFYLDGSAQYFMAYNGSASTFYGRVNLSFKSIMSSVAFIPITINTAYYASIVGDVIKCTNAGCINLGTIQYTEIDVKNIITSAGRAIQASYATYLNINSVYIYTSSANETIYLNYTTANINCTIIDNGGSSYGLYNVAASYASVNCRYIRKPRVSAGELHLNGYCYAALVDGGVFYANYIYSNATANALTVSSGNAFINTLYTNDGGNSTILTGGRAVIDNHYANRDGIRISGATVVVYNSTKSSSYDYDGNINLLAGKCIVKGLVTAASATDSTRYYIRIAGGTMMLDGARIEHVWNQSTTSGAESACILLNRGAELQINGAVLQVTGGSGLSKPEFITAGYFSSMFAAGYPTQYPGLYTGYTIKILSGGLNCLNGDTSNPFLARKRKDKLTVTNSATTTTISMLNDGIGSVETFTETDTTTYNTKALMAQRMAALVNLSATMDVTASQDNPGTDEYFYLEADTAGQNYTWNSLVNLTNTYIETNSAELTNVTGGQTIVY